MWKKKEIEMTTSSTMMIDVYAFILYIKEREQENFLPPIYHNETS